MKTNNSLLEEFKSWIRLKDQSAIYINPVKLYLGWCDTHSVDCLKINFQDLARFFTALREQYTNGYVNNFIKALRSFYKFTADLKYTEPGDGAPPIEKISFLPVENKIKDTITFEELNRIISQAVNYGCVMDDFKIRAFLYFMFFTGVRKGELLRIKRENINLEERNAIIRVPNKTKTERMVYFPDKVAQYLRQYFATEPEVKNAFNITHGQLTFFFEWVNKFAPKGKRITPHLIRHSFTVQVLAKKSFDIRVAQKILGHKSLSSTLLYYNPDHETIQELYRKNVQC